jgi:uncharacterized cupredoxin-like copper-binding protein
MARLARIGAVLAAAAIFAAACGGGAATPSTSTTITATLTDTAIALSEAAIPAGKVTFQVVNKGTVVHSLVLLKTDLPHDKIPADAKDASRASETGSLASTGSFGVGETKTFTRDLAAGNYVVICNEPAHYVVGMHLGLVVK